MKSNSTIVIVHGWTYQHRPLNKLAWQLTKSGYEVLYPDLPGFGNAAVPPKEWGVYEYATWLKEYVAKNTSSPVILVGHSFGGEIGAMCAAHYPSIVSGFIAVNPSGIRSKSFRKSIKNSSAFLGAHILSLPGASAIKPLLSRVWVRATGSYDYAKAPVGMKPILARVLTQDIRQKLSQITCPVLLLWAENDTLTPLSMSAIWKDAISQSSLIVIKGEDHSFLYERPEVVVRSINTFTGTKPTQ